MTREYRFNIGQQVSFVYGVGFGRNFYGMVVARRDGGIGLGNIYTIEVGERRDKFETTEDTMVSAPEGRKA